MPAAGIYRSVPVATQLPTPPAEVAGATDWVREHLGDLTLEGRGGVAASPAFRGGQSMADAALAAFDVRGYASGRNEVWPETRRAASALSPYIRYGLLTLTRVWEHVADGPERDREKYRDELLWQEYARHLYARLGRKLGADLRYGAPISEHWPEPWPREMACMDLTVGQLEEEGWLVNQQRMWLASQYTVRAGAPWREGEDRFFQHLLDGSRAANRLGWQWVVGTASGKPYGFSRWQVEKRAPGLCDRCPVQRDCPIQGWPEDSHQSPVAPPDALRHDPDLAATTGPPAVVRNETSGAVAGSGSGSSSGHSLLSGVAPGATAAGAETPCGDRAGAEAGAAEAVWLTAESLGDDDPALVARPGLPAVFVFDAPLLERLQLSGKKLVFFAETLGDLALRRPVEIHRGDPVEVLAGRAVAVTHAPVPGFRRRAAAIAPLERHPWPWLVLPHAGPAQSFSAWRRAARLGSAAPRLRRKRR